MTAQPFAGYGGLVAQNQTSIAKTVAQAVTELRPTVEPVARAIHADPEVAYQEVRATERLASLFSGWNVESSPAGLATAFVARTGTGDATVAVCLEYDALPEVGHACGHNLIAGAGAMAALALGGLADELGITVLAVGCPAEERIGGKVPLLDAGIFDDVDVAGMIHTVPQSIRIDPTGTSSQAVGQFRATFTGVPAHAAAAPQLGVNATDAVVISEVALALLRQQVPSDHRLSANVIRSGAVTNIIPEHAEVDFECRAWSMPEYEALLTRVRRCFEAGALATGCTLEIAPLGNTYEPLRQDPVLCAHWVQAVQDLGIDPAAGVPLAGGSTDMGNVSQRVPSIHPWVPYPGVDDSIHSHEYAQAAGRDEAYDLMTQSAVALAQTLALAATNPDDLAQLRATKRQLNQPRS